MMNADTNSATNQPEIEGLVNPIDRINAMSSQIQMTPAAPNIRSIRQFANIQALQANSPMMETKETPLCCQVTSRPTAEPPAAGELSTRGRWWTRFTPERPIRRIGNSIDLEVQNSQVLTEPPDVVWRSGCFSFDARAVRFFAQLIISLLVLCFCLYMLAKNEDPDKQIFYSSTVTGIIGIWTPAPSIRGGNSQASPNQ